MIYPTDERLSRLSRPRHSSLHQKQAVLAPVFVRQGAVDKLAPKIPRLGACKNGNRRKCDWRWDLKSSFVNKSSCRYPARKKRLDWMIRKRGTSTEQGVGQK